MIHEASRDFCKVFSDNGADSLFGADSESLQGIHTLGNS